MNHLKYGSIAEGAPNSLVRKFAEVLDCVKHFSELNINDKVAVNQLQIETINHLIDIINMVSKQYKYNIEVYYDLMNEIRGVK